MPAGSQGICRTLGTGAPPAGSTIPAGTGRALGKDDDERRHRKVGKDPIEMPPRKTAVIEVSAKSPWALSAFARFPCEVSSDSGSRTEAILSRRTLTDARWARIEGHLPGREGLPGRSGADNRLFVDAVLSLARTETLWRDPPPEFDRWTGAHARFRRWAMAGVWERVFNELSADPDFEYVLVDSKMGKAHADATGGRGASHCRAIGRSGNGERLTGSGGADERPQGPGQRHGDRGRGAGRPRRARSPRPSGSRPMRRRPRARPCALCG